MATSSKKTYEICVTDILQVFSNNSFVGIYRLDIQSRMPSNVFSVSDWALTLERTANVTVLLSVAPMRTLSDVTSWQFILQYEYNIPNNMGECGSFNNTVCW